MRYVYLHGFASSPLSRKARAFERAFATRGRVLEIPQLDGGNFERLTISGQLEIVKDLLQGESACLLGSSMGGYLAALYGALHPEVEKLVLLAPAFGLSGRWEQLVGADQMTMWKETGHLNLFHYGRQAECSVGFELVTDSRLYPDFPAANQPTLIFHGSLDAVVPAALSRTFEALRPNVSLREVPSDHELLDVLEEMIAEALRFTLGATQ